MRCPGCGLYSGGEALHLDRVIGMRGLRHSQGARRSGDALPFFRGSFGRRSSFERTPSFQRQDSSSVDLSVQTVLRGFVVQKRGAAALRHPSVLPPPDIYESLTTNGYFIPRRHEGTKMTLIDAEPYSRRVIGCAIEVHRTLGPGLLEAVYEACLCHELEQAGIAFIRQHSLPVVYKGQQLDCDLKIDVIVEQALVLEIKSVRTIHSVHEAQLLT
jgi:GxxExxY protein